MNEVIFLNIDILSNLIITKVNAASTIYTEQNTFVKNSDRKSWAIIIKYEGETIYTVNGNKYTSNINNIMILPKGCGYEWQCVKSGHFMTLDFECETSCDDVFCFYTKDSENIIKKIKDLEYARAIRRPMYKLESINCVYSIILQLLKSEEKKYLPTQKHSKIEPAVEYIAKNFNLDITNDYLAELCGLSTVYFRKLFTEIYGTSPIAYVHKLRIKKAKEMLKSEYGNISEIALSLGYANIYDFSRVFKKQAGVSPSKYK